VFVIQLPKVSIINQRQILTDYAAQNGYRVAGEYVDDGVSGVSFDRPGFQQMLGEIAERKINMVITKDLSRLGREHIGTGQYIEQIFPRMGVRFIAIGDNYDSMFDEEPSADMVPMINFFNEFHAKQTSRKTRATKKSMAKAGKFQGSKPPFGYVRDPENKYHLLPDPEAAEVVKFIFQMACDGYGYKAIARQLREKGCLNPNAYINAKDPKHHEKSDYWKEPHDWHATSIKTMLHNPTHLGRIVSGRRKTRSFKDKQIIFMPEEDWIVVEGTHEGIIDQRTWDLAHEKLRTRKRCDNHGAIQIFAGLVKCADCGYAMAYSQTGARYYQCSQYNVKGKAYCSSHYIKYDELYDAVLHDIRRRAKAAAGMDAYLLANLRREASGLLTQKLRETEKEHAVMEARITELDAILGKVYEDRAMRRISKERFDALFQRYETEQSELKARMIVMTKELAEQRKSQSESEQFLRIIAAYKDITSLNSSLLNELVHSIEVGPIRMEDGIRRRSIKIKYRQFCYVELMPFDEVFGRRDEIVQAEYEEVAVAAR
jgi:DNA invertase Pin-like site-specific DNA recombinase